MAQELWLYDAEPNYDTSRPPDELETLDSPSAWASLAQLHLVDQYHRMVASGDVELQIDDVELLITAREMLRSAQRDMTVPAGSSCITRRSWPTAPSSS